MKKLFYDFEVYPNFWSVVFKNEKGQAIIIHSRMDYSGVVKKLKSKLHEIVFIGANNTRYDVVMLSYLLENYARATSDVICKRMYSMTKDIIDKNVYFKEVMASNSIPDNTYQMDVLTHLTQGLGVKEMACRLHHPKLEGLPFPPDTEIIDEQVPVVIDYNINDVDVTMKIYEQVKGDMEVIWDAIDYFGLDKKHCSETLGAIAELGLSDPTLKPNPPSKFRYNSPVDFNFKTQQFKDVEETFRGLLLEPNSNFSMEIEVDNMVVSLGLGGIHGAVPKTYFENLIDFDAKQYYPETMDKNNLVPNTFKDKKGLRKLINDKEHYGEIGETAKEKAVKLLINSFFGRTGFKNSKFYAPDKLYGVTITGQLLLLRLIEDLREAGYDVVYANTDGVTILDNGTDYYEPVVEAWADEFGYKIKINSVKRAFYRDVNNYVIESGDDEIKRKGDLDTSSNKKRSCFAKVSVDAVVEHLLHGQDIRDFIHSKNDLREFLMYHKYNSDIDVFLEQNGKLKHLPNVVRYVLVNDREDKIVHKKRDKDTYENRLYNDNVRLVPTFVIEEDGKVRVPTIVDKERYVKIAYDILHKVTGKDVEDNPYIEGILEELELN